MLQYLFAINDIITGYLLCFINNRCSILCMCTEVCTLKHSFNLKIITLHSVTQTCTQNIRPYLTKKKANSQHYELMNHHLEGNLFVSWGLSVYLKLEY